MEGIYPLSFGGRPVGSVQLVREGLYYRFICHCRLVGEVVCRVLVTWGDFRDNLGILVPAGDEFVLDTRVPVKRFGKGKPEFTVTPSRAPTGEKFIPISPEEPFAYLERLKDAYLETREGRIGIVLKNIE